MSRNIRRLDLVHRQVETFLSTGARRLRMNKCHKWGLKTGHPKKIWHPKRTDPNAAWKALVRGITEGFLAEFPDAVRMPIPDPTTKIGD
jgi:hypothetical protein